jgi:DnaJ-class molecular chaperone
MDEGLGPVEVCGRCEGDGLLNIPIGEELLVVECMKCEGRGLLVAVPTREPAPQGVAVE